MANRTIQWYYDTKNAKLYDANGNPEGALIPSIFAGELAGVAMQLCVGEPTFNSSGALTNPDTRFADTLATGEFVVDNDYNHYEAAALAVALTSGTAVSTITVSGIASVRTLGAVKLDATHKVYFCAAERDTEGRWVLTTANSSFVATPYTPEASYAALTAVSVLDQPIIVGSNASAASKATGLFTAELDANNPIFLDLIEDNANISNTMIEFSVYVEGRPVLKCRTLLDCLGALSLPPSQTYDPPYIWAALDSRYVTITQWSLADEYQFSVSGGTAASWHDTQTDADKYYRIRRGEAAAWGEEIKLPDGAKGDAGTSATATVVKSGTVATITCTTGTVSTTATVSDGAQGAAGAIVTSAGAISVTIDGGTAATLVNSISGGTTSVEITGGTTLVIPRAFLATSGECEYDLIDANGENIDGMVTRGWIAAIGGTATGYTLTLDEPWEDEATYTVKPSGIKGADGAVQVVGSGAVSVTTSGGTAVVGINADGTMRVSEVYATFATINNLAGGDGVIDLAGTINGGAITAICVSAGTHSLAAKQDALTAGIGVEIEANTISLQHAMELDPGTTTVVTVPLTHRTDNDKFGLAFNAANFNTGGTSVELLVDEQGGLTTGSNGLAVDYTAVQGKLVAGSNISFSGNTISAAGGTIVGGVGIAVSGNTVSFKVGDENVLYYDELNDMITVGYSEGITIMPTSEGYGFGVDFTTVQAKLVEGTGISVDNTVVSVDFTAVQQKLVAAQGVTITGGTTIAAPKYGNTDTTSIPSGTVEVAAWTKYTGTCDALTIASIVDSDQESMLLVTFAGTASAPDIGFPVGTHYPAEMTFPTYEAGKTYLVSVQNSWVIVSEQATVEAE